MNQLTKFDHHCLLLAIKNAEKTFKNGNYPVGAVLAVDEKIVDQEGNKIKQGKSFTNHAENSLIMRNGTSLYRAYKNNNKISLYSTLEPCIQCLGAAVTNHINRIIFIQKDPNGGACSLKHNNIGQWYRKTWPEIIYAPISEKPLNMMLEFFKTEIKSGNKSWAEKMLKLLAK
jgi:tRNA(adenine34) deaminase